MEVGLGGKGECDSVEGLGPGVCGRLLGAGGGGGRTVTFINVRAGRRMGPRAERKKSRFQPLQCVWTDGETLLKPKEELWFEAQFSL